MRFEPIAIVGRGAVLPGALGPDAFWANLAHGRTSLGPAPEGRWRVPRERMMTTPDAPEDGTWSDIGGYVRGFEFDPAGLAIDVRGLDPQVEWVLHGVRAALREAGQEGPAPRAGLVLGNLSFPTAGMAAYAEQVWRGAPRSDARNRFMSGLPAHLAAQALGLGAGAFSLDAACASSLYAIKLACDRLHDRGADLMVAGAVNCADDLFIHVGFSALSALSRTGQSRPFHRGADGLVPAEGAAFVALMRLSDVTDQDVFGVIRGVGLSNDGRGAGFLVPAEEGQQRAMRLAYEMAGIAPETVSLLECHATGTPVGDAVEVRSAAKIFADHKGLAVGSAKSNVGHLITAAGVAGLLKVIGAMRAGVRPATLHADSPIDALDGTPLRLLQEAEPWDGPRRAAISAFGFGGNNAHLVVDNVDLCGAVDPLPPKRSEPVAIVAIGARVGNGENSHDLRKALFSGAGDSARRETVDVKLTGLRVPPLDLKRTLAQQLLVLEAAREAVEGLELSRERTMVLVGMGCDPEVARYGARWRAEDGDEFTPVLTSAGVVGTMPNIVANRLNSHLDLAGPSFTVSAEEASGLVALEIAARAIGAGEADAAVVGAVDLSHEPVHRQALKDLGLDREPGDAAIVLVLKRLSDVDKSDVIALLDDVTSESDDLDFDPGELFGNPHAAKGLLAVATAALALRHRAIPRAGAPADPAFDVCAAEVAVKPLAGKEKRVLVKACTSRPWVAEHSAKLRVYSGADKRGVIQALEAGRESDTGPARLVLLGDEEPAKHWLTHGGPKPEGVAFRETPLTGEIGFVFTGGISAYPGMGRELLLAFPDLIEEIEARSGSVREAAAWAFDGPDSAPRTVLDQIWGTALLSQVHAAISRDLLGLEPSAALGYSAGESNALVALGVWTDMRALIAEMNASGMFTREVAGEFAAIRRAWARAGIAGTRWKNYLVGIEPDLARKALDGEVAAHLIAINSPDSCLIGGDVPACERVLARLDPSYTLPIPYELAVHTPELGEVRGQWWRLHNRPATPPDGVRFYSCATTGSYLPTAERAADALTAQAVGTMDFAGTVERAWDDGVRIFIEHGPKTLCTDWIRRTLGDREHLAIPLDAQDGRSVRQLSRVAAELVAAGVSVDSQALFDRLAASLPADREPDRVVTLPAHLPEIKVPETTMARAPHLPSVLSIVDTKGPLFDRKQLEQLAVGKISELFGELFAAQDGYARQTRMPSPPMLLADRVIDIDAVAGSMGTGTIRTETDVEPGSWYLDSTGRMPPGILVEAGQADLLLISWLGADLLNRGERVYRLLGCELTFHGSPPKPGEKLEYEIHIDDHAELGGVRLFFFHYDCHVDGELRLSVRKGQAGFFTDQELAASAGVIWDPGREEPPAGQLDPPAITGAPRRYDADAIRAFAEGRPADCFGKAWDITRSHSRTPRIDEGDLLFLREVTDFEPAGGPWRRGYLRAETPITPDDWFFEGHFKNDPCMPGTLMFQGCLQAMAFYLAACGFTLGNDAWRFEPVPGAAYDLRCRGQVTPASKNLAYEVFVTELSAGPNPTVFADVLCTVDGVKAFHAKRVGLRLVPDWPLEQWRDRLLAETEPETGLVAEVDGVRFGYESLLSCAWGKPSGAFGELYSRFDGHRRVARLPGPPYHFMTRITETTGKLGGMEVGSSVVADYEVPDRVWYFDENKGTMPLAVLMEVALQPCGWLASFVGCAVEIADDLLFRNLDGEGIVSGYITPETKVIRTHATLRDISVTGTMIIVSFAVECFADDTTVFTMDTVFGFFPKSAFEDQQGLRASDAERAAIAAPPGPVTDLTTRPAKYCAGPLRLAGPMLLMLDRVTGYDPAGGEAGLGRLTAEKDVDAGEWFFKAHFFQDPVQPGSLGIEAMYQLLQFYLIERGAGAGMTAPRFEVLTGQRPLVWKYRGQVVPAHGVIGTELEITEFGGNHARAKAWLWVDGKRIYSAVDLGVRVVEGEPAGEEVLDVRADTWLGDHRPTWTVPALPMMSVVDRLAPAEDAFVLEDIELRRWIPATGPIRLKSEKDGEKSTVLAWRDATTPALSRFEPVATATIGTPGSRPQTLAPLANVETVTGFYASGSLFHGPAFQYLKSLRRGSNGASGVLDASLGSVPRGRLNQGLLDAATHVIPHDSLWQWVSSIPSGQVAYPCRISRFEQFEPLPDSGEIEVEARFAGLDGRFPIIDLQLIRAGRVLVAMRLVEVLMPTGSFGTAAPEHRRAFLRDRTYVDGLGLSRTKAGSTTLTRSDVEQCDWLVGTVAQVYGLPPAARGRDHLAQIAVRDHVARQARVHPSAVDLSEDLLVAHVAGTPYRVELEQRPEAVTVRS